MKPHLWRAHPPGGTGIHLPGGIFEVETGEINEARIVLGLGHQFLAQVGIVTHAGCFKKQPGGQFLRPVQRSVHFQAKLRHGVKFEPLQPVQRSLDATMVGIQHLDLVRHGKAVYLGFW
ncbi:MAG TPA: hypothetical protein DCP71_13390, partial [Verrucomicrobiales bacterium]|nr:hypothetical protein [Verrucomicrobiales bacterium]